MNAEIEGMLGAAASRSSKPPAARPSSGRKVVLSSLMTGINDKAVRDCVLGSCAVLICCLQMDMRSPPTSPSVRLSSKPKEQLALNQELEEIKVRPL